MITHPELTRLLSYDKYTGIFRWLIDEGKKKPGKIAGSVNKISGYSEIRVNKVLYYGHRLAWFYTHKVWPSDHIDHDNNCRSDNRLFNLQDVTCSQNTKKSVLASNNTTGFKGVVLARRGSGRYFAQITVNYVDRYLGSFSCPREAAKAYDAAAELYHGKFARTNKELGLLCRQ